MSTIDRVQSMHEHEREVLDGKGLRIAIAVAEWNREVTHSLLEGAIETLKQSEVEGIDVMHVPGAFELVNAAARLKQDSEAYDAIIVIGCVVRGDTPHFDYICQGVTNGISQLNAQPNRGGVHLGSYVTPIIFCVLTTETMQQALDRAGGALGNKGSEAAEAALMMVRPRIEYYS